MSNEENAARFNEELAREMGPEQVQRIQDFRNALGFLAIDGIIDGSPVYDGPFRASWQIETGVPVGGVATEGEPKAATKARLRAAMEPVPAFTTVYIATNMPQSNVIEYGGYPSPVKRGTFVGQKGRRMKRRASFRNMSAEEFTAELLAGNTYNYEIRSAGGFSKQAPQGVVAPVVAALENFVQE